MILLVLILAVVKTDYCEQVVARLDIVVDARDTEALVTFLPTWVAPPDDGWLSDGGPAEEIHQAAVTPTSSVTWGYPLRPEPTLRFGFLTIRDGTRICEIRTNFLVPGMVWAPTSLCPPGAPALDSVQVVGERRPCGLQLVGTPLGRSRKWCWRQGFSGEICPFGNDAMPGGREQRLACEIERGPYMWSFDGNMCGARSASCISVDSDPMTFAACGAFEGTVEVCGGGGLGPCTTWICDENKLCRQGIP